MPEEIAGVVKLERVVKGLERPLALEAAADGRVFVVEQGGRIRILRDGRVSERPFLDVKKLVSRDHEERGLLGLALHPKFASNGLFYVNYTDRRGTTRVVEYQVSASDPDLADPGSAREVFQLAQPYANHNGGGLEFGPDGRLWVGTGDGGAAGDPKRAGQNPDNRLAKMLRIDVGDPSSPVDVALIGLRNPWRYAFDAPTGDLYIGDVGQDLYEEVHVVPSAVVRGGGTEVDRNLGWNVMEAAHCYARRGCDKDRFAAPAVEYDRKVGCSITGGEVYRGRAIPELDGVYFYADYCTAVVRSFRWAAGAVYQHWDWKPVLDADFRLSTVASFGLDAEGELYVVSLDGAILKLVRR